MKNFVWVGLCIIAISIILASFIKDENQSVIPITTHTAPSPLIQDVKVASIRPFIAHSSSAIATATSSAMYTGKSESSAASSASEFTPYTPTPKQKSNADELDPELIDRTLTAPFNQIVKEKLVGEGDRGRFKKFAASDSKDEWSLSMEHHLYDGIISHPLAKFITIQSINCKSSICELQIYEQQNDSWNQVVSDLANQPWWDFESFSTYTFVAMVDLRRRNAIYVLLGKTQ